MHPRRLQRRRRWRFFNRFQLFGLVSTRTAPVWRGRVPPRRERACAEESAGAFSAGIGLICVSGPRSRARACGMAAPPPGPPSAYPDQQFGTPYMQPQYQPSQQQPPPPPPPQQQGYGPPQPGYGNGMPPQPPQGYAPYTPFRPSNPPPQQQPPSMLRAPGEPEGWDAAAERARQLTAHVAFLESKCQDLNRQLQEAYDVVSSCKPPHPSHRLLPHPNPAPRLLPHRLPNPMSLRALRRPRLPARRASTTTRRCACRSTSASSDGCRS